MSNLTTAPQLITPPPFRLEKGVLLIRKGDVPKSMWTDSGIIPVTSRSQHAETGTEQTREDEDSSASSLTLEVVYSQDLHQVRSNEFLVVCLVSDGHDLLYMGNFPALISPENKDKTMSFEIQTKRKSTFVCFTVPSSNCIMSSLPPRLDDAATQTNVRRTESFEVKVEGEAMEGSLCTSRSAAVRDDWVSVGGGAKCDLHLVLLSDLHSLGSLACGEGDVVVHWVHPDGSMRQRRVLAPSGDHVEDGVHYQRGEMKINSFLGHVFVVSVDRPRNANSHVCSHISDIRDEDFICVLKCDTSQEVNKFTITRRVSAAVQEDLDTNVSAAYMGCAYTDKDIKYIKTEIHNFTVYSVAGTFVRMPGVLTALQEDLHIVTQLLPPSACQLLQARTAIYGMFHIGRQTYITMSSLRVNESITYGKHPSRKTVGRFAHYHPTSGKSWLEQRGLRAEKAGCVEICCIDDYLSNRAYWGTGGLLLHELSHAYHDHGCAGGYHCETIQKAYTQAMEKQLYTEVCKGWSKNDCYEYFAELSVAYLWGQKQVRDNREELSGIQSPPASVSPTPSPSSYISAQEEVLVCPSSCHYNKWFPYNCYQLCCHDLDSFEIIHALWHAHNDESED